MHGIEQENWDDWEREDQYEAEPKCLFCAETFELPEDAFQHCQQVHGFDFLAVKRSLGKSFFLFSLSFFDNQYSHVSKGLDFYKCIRMINYIRKQVNDMHKEN